jgi:hypothetical protein
MQLQLVVEEQEEQLHQDSDKVHQVQFHLFHLYLHQVVEVEVVQALHHLI